MCQFLIVHFLTEKNLVVFKNRRVADIEEVGKEVVEL